MAEEQLGEVRREFKPGLGNLAAGVIIGLLMIAAGGACVYFPSAAAVAAGGRLPGWAEKGWSWGSLALMVVVGLVLVAGGVGLIVVMRSMLGLRVRVGRHGFAVADRKGVRVVGWDDILAVRETHLFERPPVLKGVAKYALPKMMSKSYLLTLKDGDPFGFDGNSIKGHAKLARMIEEETSPRGIPWEVVEQHA